MEKMRAVTHSLRNRAYLILAGAIKQPMMGRGNWNIITYDDDYFYFPSRWFLHKKQPPKSCTFSSHLHQLQSKYQTQNSCLSFQSLSLNCTSLKSLFFLFCFHQSCERTNKILFDGGVWKKNNNVESCRPWGWLYIIFPLQCECIIVWAVAVRSDNWGWHWKVSEFSCLWQNATQREKKGSDKTTTLKHQGFLPLSHPQKCADYFSCFVRSLPVQSFSGSLF